MIAWPYFIVFAVLIGLLLLSRRNRRRAASAETARADRLGPGSEVMTTSGLYGTVVAKHDDGTALISIAPGVEVKWAVAALRDADSLPDRYQRGIYDRPPDGGGQQDDAVPQAVDGDEDESPPAGH